MSVQTGVCVEGGGWGRGHTFSSKNSFLVTFISTESVTVLFLLPSQCYNEVCKFMYLLVMCHGLRNVRKI